MVSYGYALASNNEDNQMHSFLFLNLTRKKPLTDAPYFLKCLLCSCDLFSVSPGEIVREGGS